MAEQTYQRVAKVVGELAGFDPATIGPGQCFGYQAHETFYGIGKPLELDSHDRVALAMRLEEEFEIQISDDEVDQPALDHVGGLVAFIQGKLDARGDRFRPFGVEIAGAQPFATLELTPSMMLAATTTPLAATSACMFGSTELDNSGVLDIHATAADSSTHRFDVWMPPGSTIRSAAERAMMSAERSQAELRRVFLAGFGMGKCGAEHSEAEAVAAWHTFRQGQVFWLGQIA